MPNPFEKIAQKEKDKALAKQQNEVEQFAKKIAAEVLGGIGDLFLKDSVAAFATSVAQAVVLSNETIDASLKDNFTRLLSAVKNNKPNDANYIKLSKKIGEQIASLEAAFDKVELSPTINLQAVSADDLRTEVGKILARLPTDSLRVVTVAYENATADQYLNVRLTDGISFYKASAGGGGSGGGLTDAQLRASPVPVTATPSGTQNVDVTANTVGLATSAKQDTLIGHVDGLEASTASIDSKTPALGQALAAASTPVVLTAAQQAALTPPAAITGYATSAKQDTLLAELQLKADLTETQPVSLASVPSHAVTNAGTFAVQNTAALPAGTNAIGKLAANSGVDIGDVDVTSIAAGTNVIGGMFPTPSGAAAQALSNDTSTAYEASSVTKASAGTVYGVTGYNSKTSAQFFQFFNSTTVPADTAVPVIVIRVAALSNFSIDFGVYGRRFSTGIAWSNSSTGATKTIGSNDIFCDVNYV